jgi:Tfp pilus assembly protein PilO
MPKSFKLPEISVKDPRVVMRGVIGLLLASNLAAAVLAFHPFGGGAEDMRREQRSLSSQLSAAQARLKASQALVGKVQKARTEGDEFLTKYFMNSQLEAAQMLSELTRTSEEAGVKVGNEAYTPEEIEGSDTLMMVSAQVGLEGSYANLTKFVNLLDKSPRFLIIESMQASAPQQQQQGARAQPDQALNVTLKIDAFIKYVPGAAL